MANESEKTQTGSSSDLVTRGNKAPPIVKIVKPPSKSGGTSTEKK